MARSVKILRAGTVLPDGRVYYVVGQTITLSDDEFEHISPGSFSAGWVQDLGPTPNDVTSIVTLTQAEYDAIATPDPTTLYIVTG